MKFVVSLLLVLFTTPLFAETAPKDTDSDDSKDYIVTPKAVVQTGSSEHHRIDKTHQITAILFGIGPSISSTLGLQYGYFLKRNQLVVLEGTTGKLGYSSIDVLTGYDLDIKTKSFGAHFKHFTGNSFYYRAGLDFRTIEYNYRRNGSTTDYGKFNGTSVAANFQIGNQWQWSNFTLGCDWLGLSAPLTSSVSDKEVGSTAPGFMAGSLDDDANTLTKKVHLNVLRFYLGASF